MPEPTLPVAPIRADDPKKKKQESEDEKGKGKDTADASKVNGEVKEGEGEELVNCIIIFVSYSF